MNKERIELSAKSKLEGLLSRLGYVTPELSSNDKTPSWDGFIRLYDNEDSSSSDELFRMIPVQLKGHYQKPPYNQTISYNVNLVDLKNYYNHNGVIFFVVYIDEEDNYKIYYETLSPFKIRRTIKGKENQKTISITFSSFPNNKEEAVDVFSNFTIDMNLYPPPARDITLNDALRNKIPGYDTFNISYRGIKYKDDPFGYFLTHPTTVTLKNSFTGFSFPLDTVFMNMVGSKHNKPITIKGKKYYDSFDVYRYSNNNLELKFGKSFTFIFHDDSELKKINFNYKITGTLPERILDLRFLLDYLKNKEFQIANHTGFKLTDEQLKTVDMDYFQNNLRLLEYIDELLKKLKVSTILDYDNVTEEEEKTFIKLINTVLLGATLIPNEKNKLYKLKFANIDILLFENQIDEKNSKLINYFSDDNKAQYGYAFDGKEEHIFLMPKSFVLKEDDFVCLDNIDFDVVYNEIILTQKTENEKEFTYYYVTDMVNGYLKRTKEKKDFHSCLLKILKFLKNNSPDYDYGKLENKLISNGADRT